RRHHNGLGGAACHAAVRKRSSAFYLTAPGCRRHEHKPAMRIAYGVMGYGRGHAMRTMSVLPALMRHHDVTVFAGGDAHDVLAPLFPAVRIPTIGYRYNRRGSHSF